MYKYFEILLKERNTNATQVSKETGVPRATFTDWKKGRSEPKADKLKKIADYFGVPMDYFFDGKINLVIKAVPTSEHQTGYYNPETAKAAQEMLDDPDLHALMDAARDARPEYVKSAIQLLKTLKETNPDG